MNGAVAVSAALHPPVVGVERNGASGRCLLLWCGRLGVLWRVVARGDGDRRETNGAIDGRCILPSDEGSGRRFGSSTSVCPG